MTQTGVDLIRRYLEVQHHSRDSGSQTYGPEISWLSELIWFYIQQNAFQGVRMENNNPIFYLDIDLCLV